MLVADVARRRPLLGRDALPAALGAAACTCRRPARAVLAAAPSSARRPGPRCRRRGRRPRRRHGRRRPGGARPELVAAFGHVVFLDPPFSAALHDAVVAAAPDAWVHQFGATADVHFTEKVLAAGYDLDAALRSRVARARGGRRPV